MTETDRLIAEKCYLEAEVISLGRILSRWRRRLAELDAELQARSDVLADEQQQWRLLRGRVSTEDVVLWDENSA